MDLYAFLDIKCNQKSKAKIKSFPYQDKKFRVYTPDKEI